MGWKASSGMDEKLRFVFAYERDEEPSSGPGRDGADGLRGRTGLGQAGLGCGGFGHGGFTLEIVCAGGKLSSANELVVRCDQPRVLDIAARGGRIVDALPPEILDEVLAKVGTLFE